MIKKAYVDTKGGQIHYRYSSGGTGIPLVMFHKTAASSASYEPFIAGAGREVSADRIRYGQLRRELPNPSRAEHRAYRRSYARSTLCAEDRTISYLRSPYRVDMLSIWLSGRPTGGVSGSHGANYITMEENARRRKTMAEPNQINVKGTQFMWAWSRVKDSSG